MNLKILNFNDFIKKESSDYTSYDNSHGESFWGNRGAGVLAIAYTSGKILVPMRSDYVNEPNTWGVIGGKVDSDDKHLEKTVKREFEEETGYDGKLKLFKAAVYSPPGVKFKYHNYIGLVDDEFEAIPNWETSYFEWVTLDELFRLEPKHFGLEFLLKNSIWLIQDVIRSRYNK